MQKILRYLFIGVLLPVLVHYVFYYQLTTNYTRDAFSEKGFREIYDTKVYKSRQLGKNLHLWVYHKLSSISKFQSLRDKKDDISNPMNTVRLAPMDASSDPVFYFTYFLIAVIFTSLTALLLLLLFRHQRLFPVDDRYKDLAVSFLVLLIGFTQFVVTPYDTPGYFFQALGMFCFLRFWESRNKLFFLLTLLTIAIATFNRETSLLILSFMAAMYFSVYRFNAKWLREMILPVLFFIIPYLYLKLFQGGGASFTDESKLAVNLDPRNSYALRGLAFSALVIYLVLTTLNPLRSPVSKYFLLFALPYLIIIHAVGVMIEYRLWMPVIEAAIVLNMIRYPARIEVKTNAHSREVAHR